MPRVLACLGWMALTWAVWPGLDGDARAQLRIEGAPTSWQMGLQPPASPVAEAIASFHDLLLWIICAITLFVIALLGYILVRYHERLNPKPSTTSHNVTLEIIWTVIPVLILVAIAIPSFRLLYYQDRVENAEMVVKVVGRQWYWEYHYPEHGDLVFDSILIPEDELQPGQLRLLEVDQPLVVPTATNITILVTARDVLHSFAVPALGLKTDAIPGRLNQTWVRIDKPGRYYGQCSELCGQGHAYMPIVVDALEEAEFQAWVEQQARLAGDSSNLVALAAASDDLLDGVASAGVALASAGSAGATPADMALPEVIPTESDDTARGN